MNINNLHRIHEKPGDPAQAIVEFAIVLPILLALLIGILEVGRAVFIYTALTNASREAVRYGSAIGFVGPNTQGYNPYFHRYKFCRGIWDTAEKSAYFQNLQDSDIVIEYDHGPNTLAPASMVKCDASSGEDPDVVFSPGDRIIVQITTSYSPLTKLLPLGTKQITSESARTILGYSPVGGTGVTVNTPWPTLVFSPTPGGPTDTPTDTLTPTDTPTITPTYTPSLTPTITPTYTPSLTPTITATNTPKKPTNTPINTPTNTATQTTTFTPTTIPTSTATSTPTLTFTPTATRTPTATPTNTITLTPTKTPIACTPLTHGALGVSGSTISMTINNGTGFPLSVQDVTVTWNNQGGAKLNSASLTGTFWTGSDNGPSYTITPGNLSIPTGSSTITFSFSKSLTANGTERILINLGTNGCSSIDSSK